MKEDIMIRAIGGIDDKLIEGAEKAPKANRTRFTWVKWGSIAAAFVFLAALGAIALPAMFKTDDPVVITEWPVKHAANTAGESEIYGPITKDAWSVTGNAGRYVTLLYSDNEYRTCTVVVDPANKGSFIGDGKVTGQDPFSLEMHEMNVQVYAIQGIDPQFAVAVRFSEPDQSVNGSKNVYAYMNTDYAPVTLGDFIHDLDLDEKMDVGLVYMYQAKKDTVVFENLTKEKVMELLSDCSDSENTPEVTTGKKIMGISVSLLGMNKSISLTEDGYLKTNIFETGKCFYIGRDKIDEFAEYVTHNCDGYIYVYDSMTGASDE